MSQHYSTPRSVRTHCLEQIKGIVKERSQISRELLKQYILRQYNISPQTFDRYIKDLILMGLIGKTSKKSNETIVWIEQEIDLTQTTVEVKKRKQK